MRIALQTEEGKDIDPKKFVNELRNIITKVDYVDAPHRECVYIFKLISEVYVS